MMPKSEMTPKSIGAKKSLLHARVHFIGIGGIGMCGLAELLHNMGTTVSGSDLAENANVMRLREMGISISIGHRAENVHAAEVVVYSSAVRPQNPEFSESRRLNIPLIPRAEALAEIMRLKRGVAVGGSHGKTTTTSMIATVFLEADLKPTIVVGGRLELIRSTALLGAGDWMVAEADESDGSFSRLNPEVAIVTNIDNDHLDHYGTFEHLKKAFFDFAGRVPFYGAAIVCWDDPVVRETFEHFGKRLIRYGTIESADLRMEGDRGSYSVFHGQQRLGEFRLSIPGRHNALNALAAIAAGIEAGIPFDVVARGISRFNGVDRRFQHKGEVKGVDVFDDYGHHPTEIEAVLKAFREKYADRRLVVIFQPHRYTRTKQCWEQFLGCFKQADLVFLTDIYPAGEDPLVGVDSDHMMADIRSNGALPKEGIKRIHSSQGLSARVADVAREVAAHVQKGDAVFTLGAGDIFKLSPAILEALR